MIELLIFFSLQFILNLIIYMIRNQRISYVFTSLAMLFFGVLILVYPFWSWRIYDFIYPPDPTLEFRCGNMQMGAAIFQWLFGIPLVIALQWTLNKVMHKSSYKNAKIDKD